MATASLWIAASVKSVDKVLKESQVYLIENQTFAELLNEIYPTEITNIEVETFFFF